MMTATTTSDHIYEAAVLKLAFKIATGKELKDLYHKFSDPLAQRGVVE